MLPVLLCAGSVAAQGAKPLPGGQKGLLTVTVEVKGAVARNSVPNPQVRENWTIQRKAQFQVPLVSLMSAPMDAQAEEAKAAPVKPDPAQMKAGAQLGAQIQNAIKDCAEEDEACQAAAVQRLMSRNPPAARAMPQAPLPAPDLDFTRFHTWIADRQGACASGTASIEERMDGTATPDNSGGLWVIDGDRAGELKLPTQAQASQSCETQVSFDRTAQTYSLRIGAMNIAIPAAYHIQRKGFPKSEPHRLSYGLFEYTDVTFPGNRFTQPALKGTAAGFDGSVTLPSRKPFQEGSMRVTPQVTTTIRWHFAPA